MTVTVEDMKDKLKTQDWLRETLAQTEPIASRPFNTAQDRIHFRLENDWAQAAEGLEGTAPVQAFITIQAGHLPGSPETEYQLSKDGLLEATSICGIPKKYAERTPADLITPQLNYWFGTGLGDKSYQALIAGQNDTAMSLTKGTIQPFSNLSLLEHALAGIERSYGAKAREETLVDYKFQHDLRRTRFSLIVPEKNRLMERTGTDNDEWAAGINIANSLTGLEQTQLSGYLFRWWCTNGAIDTHATTGTWSRRAGQGDEVWDWTHNTIDEILGGLDHSFDAVQGLVDVPLDDNVVVVLRDIFEQYRVPQNERERVIENMVNSEQTHMYAVMQAVTQVANRDEIDAGHMQALMRIGGELPHTVADRCDGCHRVLPH